MLARLRNWLFGGATEKLPERVRERRVVGKQVGATA